MLRQIMFAGVTDNEHNESILIERGGYAQRGGEIGPRGSAAKNSLQAPQHARQLKRFTISHVDHFVDVLDVHVRWDDLLPDSLDEIRSGFNDLSGLFVSLEDRAVGIRADDANARILLLK